MPCPPQFAPSSQLFYSFFKTLVGKEIAVELKNDVALTGTLHSVDQYLNIKLNDVNVVDGEKYPQLVSALSPRFACRVPRRQNDDD